MLDYGGDPEVFRRDDYGYIRQVDSSSDADTIIASFRGALAAMRFRLVYDGNLPAAGSSTRAAEKWVIRRSLRPQLEGLWNTHPTLKGRGVYTEGSIGWSPLVVHESLGTVRNKINEPIMRGEREFVPLVRKSLALTCELDILFLRNDAPGSVVTPSGGDLDNRIKTLFDGLRTPHLSEIDAASVDDPQPFYCLLEDDALISTFSVRTDRLLTAPGQSENRVLLVMEVKVTAERLTGENLAFLTE